MTIFLIIKAATSAHLGYIIVLLCKSSKLYCFLEVGLRFLFLVKITLYACQIKISL